MLLFSRPQEQFVILGKWLHSYTCEPNDSSTYTFSNQVHCIVHLLEPQFARDILRHSLQQIL